jgi:kumamolisin
MRTLSLSPRLILSVGMIFPFSVYCQVVATPCGTVASLQTPIIQSTTAVPATGETPASIACVYGLTPNVPGCTIPQTAANLPSGGWGVIAVTEGFDDPFALQELNAFSANFGLPLMSPCTDLTKPSAQPCFATVYSNNIAPTAAYGLGPPSNPDLFLKEHALDIEMTHAMAPNASIIMVEAPTFGQFDTPSIFTAVQCASQIVQAMGGGVISNSWSNSRNSNHEYPSESSNDVYFQTPGIVYTGSSGDTLAPANYPAISPHVVGVGGTQFIRDSNGKFVKETAWIGDAGDGSSGGPSLYIPRPSFQNFVSKIVGSKRGSPDIAAVGKNIDTYYLSCSNYPSSSNCQAIWIADAGTSYSSPIMAGIINAAGSRAQSSQAELALIYNGAQKHYHSYWHDIIEGNNGYPTLQGYDFVTGLGSPRGYLGK